MRYRPTFTLTAIVLLLSCGTALAQRNRDEWRQQQDRKQELREQLRLVSEAPKEQGMAGRAESPEGAVTGFTAALTAASTVFDPVTLTSIKSYSDTFGNIVLFGEVQNTSASTLTFTEVTFDFYLGSAYVGSDSAFVYGSENARLSGSTIYTAALPPGAFGFFKIWTDIPTSSVDDYDFSSTAETYEVVSPLANLSSSAVTLPPPDVLGLTHYSGTVTNTGTGLAYNAMVALAGYSNGSINDVSFTFVNGSTFVTPCGNTTTNTVLPGATRSYGSVFLRPVSSIGRLALEWDEIGLAPVAVNVAPGGTSGTIAVTAPCTWSATSNASWIVVTGATGNGIGSVNYTVQPNTGAARTGTITIAGHTFTVTQTGVACGATFSPLFSWYGAGETDTFVQVTANPGCAWQTSSGASWITVTAGATGNGQVRVTLGRNTSSSPRSGSFTIAGQVLTVNQLGLDFPLRESDLIWQHLVKGTLVAWFMDGMNMSGSAVIGSVSDPSWRVVGTGDFNRDNNLDLVWQHNNGTVVIWFMIGTGYMSSLTVGAVSDPNWEVAGAGDFNGDGHPDLLWRHRVSGNIVIWRLADGHYVGGDVVGAIPDFNWHIKGIGDFDQDGDADILWQRPISGFVYVWIMNKTAFERAAFVGSVTNTDWIIVGATDFNSDGHTDILWQNVPMGKIVAWLMNQTNYQSSVDVGQVSDINWRIVAPK